jgi:ubiquinone/menaquinone biosynthesis C-methylase UbiE
VTPVHKFSICRQRVSRDKAFLNSPMRNKKRTQAIYNQLRASYAKLYGEEQREKHDILLRELKIQRSEICLDLGCGTGEFMSRLAHKSRLVVGIDLSSEMVLASKERLRRSSKCELVRADGEYLPFKQRSFHTLFAITVVLDYLGVPAAVEEAKRTLSKGGVAVFTIVRKAEEFHRTGSSIDQSLLEWEVRKMQVGRDVGWFARRT